MCDLIAAVKAADISHDEQILTRYLQYFRHLAQTRNKKDMLSWAREDNQDIDRSRNQEFPAAGLDRAIRYPQRYLVRYTRPQLSGPF